MVTKQELRKWERLGRDEEKPFDIVFDAIEDFIFSELPNAEIDRVGVDKLSVDSDGNRQVISFGLPLLNDYKAVLERENPIHYANGIRNQVNAVVLMALGPVGMIPQVKVSQFVLDEDRAWLTSCYLDTRFRPDFAAGLYDGLCMLRDSLKRALASALELPEVVKDLDVVTELITFYDENKNLNTTRAEAASLSYLKAAAVCWILEWEGKMATEPQPRLKKAIQGQIYDIFAWTQTRPYIDLKLPDAIYDYVAARTDGSAVTVAPNRVEGRAELRELLREFDPRLAARWEGAWAALRSDNLDRVSQAANSMVEIVDQVVGRLVQDKTLGDYLKDRFPKQVSAFIQAKYKFVTETKNALQAIKHHPEEQSVELADSVMRGAELTLEMLLR